MNFESLMSFFYETSGSILTIIITLIVLSISEKRKNIKLEENKQKFIQKILQELNLNRLVSIKQVKRIYAVIINKNYFYLELWIEEALLNITSESDIEKYKILENMLNELEFQEPFSKLPEEEKDLFKTLKEYKDKDIDTFNEKLYRLSDVIKTRYIEKEKADTWVKRLGIFASILTVFSFFK